MSETIDKTIDVVRTVTTEPVMRVVNQRLSNPFFLCFISSWVLCNWERVLILLFAFGQGIEQRIEKIKLIPSNSVFLGYSIAHTHTFWYPFFAAVFFVVGYPFISLMVDKIHNGVIKKKNRNDSLRKESVLASQMIFIAKQVEYDHFEEQQRLQAKKATQQIELDTSAIEKNFVAQGERLKELEKQVKDREMDLERHSKQYDDAMNSIAKVRDELDLKKAELVALNGDIIKNQNILDDINKEISNKVIPGTAIAGVRNSLVGNTLFGGSGGVVDKRATEMAYELGLNRDIAKRETKAPTSENTITLHPERNKKE